jgi:hypothetical protein
MNRDEARELLPWYAVGALEPDQARAVEAHLADSPELAHELTQYETLREAVAEVPADEPAFRPELLNDALARIDALEADAAVDRTSTAVPEKDEASGGWLSRLLDEFRTLGGGPRLALAAQFCLLLVLGTVAFLPDEQASTPVSREFTTLSGEQGAAETGGPQFSVVFDPGATQAEVTALLERLDAQLVAGPSAQQAYVIALPTGDRREPQALLETLRGDASVRFATELGAGR